MKYLLLLLIGNAYAIYLNPNTGRGFENRSVTVHVASTDCSNAGFSTAGLKDLLEDAVDDYWNAVPTADLKLKVAAVGSTDIDGMDHNQILNAGLVPANSILAGCNDDAFPQDSKTLGSAVMTCSGDTCRGVLIINARADSPVPDINNSEKIATMAHEIGHALGLGHTPNTHNLMYYAVGGKTQTWLGQDDIDGINYLYPYDEPVLGCDFLPLLGSMGTIKDIGDDDNFPPGGFLATALFGVFLTFFLRGTWYFFQYFFQKSATYLIYSNASALFRQNEK
ncbi:MAG: matrixin family metalloprotease [Bacteriovoracaceae bacterium]